MYTPLSPEKKSLIWLMYLRKSRQDDPNESVIEVLSKHENMLQEWARRVLGREIPEDCIYREIVSGGESIDEREEIRKVLSRIEDPRVAGVVVADPQRLTRGELEDCGRLISTLRYTSTMVATPSYIYDMEIKRDRSFFEDELMRGRAFLDYTKEKLLIGREQACLRGCYIGKESPYGYRKVKIGKNHTLEPDDNADVVRMMYDLYVNEDYTYLQICDKLTDLGIKPRKGKNWNKTSVRYILKNPHYDGKIAFNMVKEVTTVEHGERITRRINQPKSTWLVADGLHPALVDHETWVKAQEKMLNNPSAKKSYPLRNPFAGILFCAHCGLAIAQHPYKHAETRLECRQRPRHFKSVKMSVVEDALLAALEHAELPNLEAKWKSGEGKSLVIQKKLLEKLEKEMEKLRQQEDKQYDLLETGVYTPDKFEERHAALRVRIEECQNRIYQAKANMPKEINYEERIVTLKEAITGLKNPDISVTEKNRLLKAIIKKVEMKTEYHGHDDVGVHLAVFLRL